VARLLRDAERDLAKGLSVPDVYPNLGIAVLTYYRWGQKNDPVQIDTDRQCRELETEVERLDLLLAEQMRFARLLSP
jgi:hypothetical protein